MSGAGISPPGDAALRAACALLRRLIREPLTPEAAREPLRALQAQLGTGWDARLLRTEENWDLSPHFDLVITGPDGVALTMALVPDQALPWPLRGSILMSERLAVVVDGCRFSVGDVVSQLQSIWSTPGSRARLVDRALLREACAASPPAVSEAEVRRQLDEIKHRRGLGSADAESRWCATYALPAGALSRFAAEEAEIDALKEREVGPQVEPHFAAHRRRYDRLQLCRLVVPDRAQLTAIREDRELPTHGLRRAAERLIQGAPGPVQPVVTLESDWRGELESRLPPGDDLREGTLRGPVRLARGFAMFEVLAVRDGVLDASTRAKIRDDLFSSWLDSRRAGAMVRWNWGAHQQARPRRPDAEERTCT